ncbi:MAG TPA: NAD(P)/FAD-dependent oxidoreductase [Polyangiaceae bacterium]|nr:NAD(P)/FAD-dependent oxidoreductase [Polyangiaceae bacterium]
MTERHVLIIGGGLSGLSTGCYARASGFRTTIVEHSLTLGGVCTAWHRGSYTIDGCIQWLTGGAFDRIYEELGILPRVPRKTIERFLTYRDAHDGSELTISRDLAATARAFRDWAPRDGDEIERLVAGAERVAGMPPPFDRPPELASLGDQLATLWSMRHELGTIAHFRKPLGTWSREHLKSERLRRVFTRMFPEEAPALLLLMVLGYLQHGYLSRPIGGTLRFRDALIESYFRLGGEGLVSSTVDEVLVKDDRACAVRLADGTMIDADIIVSTASAPETVLRLLGGGYGASQTRERLEHWKTFQPIILASYGVALPFDGVPPTLLIDRIEPLPSGGANADYLTVRVYNDDASFAPPGHTVVQALLASNYEHWAKTGLRYRTEKDIVDAAIVERLERHLPGLRAAVRVSDMATPLTFWHTARSWKGAYEGWLPTPESMFGHIKKTLPGLASFYMAGQWVEPGGGVPMALMSGRQVAQLICADEHRPFLVPFASSQSDLRSTEAGGAIGGAPA